MKPTKPTMLCLECGDVVSKRGAKKYCSVACSIKNTSIHVSGNAYSIPKGNKPWNKGKKGIHLSPSSEFKKGSIGYWKGKKRPEMQGSKNRKDVPCAYCNKIISLQPNQLRTRNFCNRSCWALGTRGTGSPVYLGEKSSHRLRSRIAELPEYKEWRMACLRRDNFTCIMCGCKHSKKRPLEVDHIHRFFSIMQEYKIYTPDDARKCDILWDIGNGRTLCRPCHRTTDTYGTKGLTYRKAN